jgi:hypothetical protein
VVLDSADTISNADDPSFIDLEYFLPDAPLVNVVIAMRSSRAQEMTTLEASEVAELFRKCAKLSHTAIDITEGVLKIMKESGYLALAGSFMATTTRLSSDVQQYLPEYCDRWKQLLGVKVTKCVYQYVESLLSTWETSFSAVARRSPVASRLLSLLAFLNFDDIFLDLFSADTNPVTQAEDITNKTSH